MKTRAFALIELLIVVVVLAIIAGFTIPMVLRKPPAPRPTYTVITPMQTWHGAKPAWEIQSGGPYGHFYDTEGREVRVFGNFIIIEEKTQTPKE